jgi:hypothetical protein
MCGKRHDKPFPIFEPDCPARATWRISTGGLVFFLSLCPKRLKCPVSLCGDPNFQSPIGGVVLVVIDVAVVWMKSPHNVLAVVASLVPGRWW